jgi:hypothetical protein
MLMLRCRRIAELVGLALVSFLGTSFAQTQTLDLVDTPFAPAGYERLLREYVIQSPLPDGGVETRIDYARLASEPELEKFCADLRERFLSVNPLTLDRTTRQAWALNTYNFLIIDLIVNNVVGPDGKSLESIADIGEGDFSVFDDEPLREPLPVSRRGPGLATYPQGAGPSLPLRPRLRGQGLSVSLAGAVSPRDPGCTPGRSDTERPPEPPAAPPGGEARSRLQAL